MAPDPGHERGPLLQQGAARRLNPTHVRKGQDLVTVQPIFSQPPDPNGPDHLDEPRTPWPHIPRPHVPRPRGEHDGLALVRHASMITSRAGNTIVGGADREVPRVMSSTISRRARRREVTLDQVRDVVLLPVVRSDPRIAAWSCRVRRQEHRPRGCCVHGVGVAALLLRPNHVLRLVYNGSRGTQRGAEGGAQ